MGIIKKGTMRPMKKIIGIAIGIAGLGLVFNISFINNIILSGTPKIVFGVILLIIAYFLTISGRQL